MNALALELLGVAKEYLGPAAPAFLSRELHALGGTVLEGSLDRVRRAGKKPTCGVEGGGEEACPVGGLLLVQGRTFTKCPREVRFGRRVASPRP